MFLNFLYIFRKLIKEIYENASVFVKLNHTGRTFGGKENKIIENAIGNFLENGKRKEQSCDIPMVEKGNKKRESEFQTLSWIFYFA